MASADTTIRLRTAAPAATRRWLAALSILGNIGLNYWANTHPFNGQTMGAVSAKYPTLLTPAGYAFSIWGLIFLALTIYAIWQLLPAQRHTRLPDVVAQPLTVASGATAAWVVLFAYELIEASVAMMLVILVALIVAYGRAHRQVLARKAPRWTSMPLALYLGWISVASVLNITIGLRELGWQTPTNITVLLTLLLLALVVGLALVISNVKYEVVFSAAVVWALVAIWVARRVEYSELGWAALAGAVVVAVGSAVLGLRKRHKRHKRIR
ncbi:tryptophan-rich sensory protein [Hymenobacter elongatus]|uniref:Tryptophan-rich sensory protein n=1 Tax=Hymenobacter elongatus TaxID=877208 RepID=A0A4Z0PIU8_9BACT|nr:tryptophan-rich sensory protein [Hymenobacter elongatus]TGE14845.1 tryptophan-rich sensory protein [Hymenobacter elongatus]